MKRLRVIFPGLMAGLLMAGVAGCGDSEEYQGPEAMAESQVMPALEQNFAAEEAQVDPELRRKVKQVMDDFGRKNYAMVLVGIEGLSRRPDLTGDQRRILAEIGLTASQKLREASEAGDAGAEKVLEIRRQMK